MDERIHDEEALIPLARGPVGIEAFRVAGYISGEPLYAHWDGRWLRVSRRLYDYATVAIATDAAFAEAGFGPSPRSSDAMSPEDFLLAMITCCTEIDLAEYAIKGHRRVIAASS